MAEKNESSVLFSLQELMSLEEERINEEEATKAARERAERERVEAEARARREAEERSLRAEEERRRAEELRKREEEARLEAIRQAELQKAAHEAEHKSRMEALSAQQAHEQQLAALRSDKQKKKLTIAVGVVAALLVFGGIGGVVAFKNAQEQAEKEKAILLAQAEQLKAEADQNVRRLEEQLRTSASLSEAQKAALEQQIADAKKAAESASKDVSNVKAGGGGTARPSQPRPSTGGGKKTGGGSSCTPGDPMCGDL